MMLEPLSGTTPSNVQPLSNTGTGGSGTIDGTESGSQGGGADGDTSGTDTPSSSDGSGAGPSEQDGDEVCTETTAAKDAIAACQAQRKGWGWTCTHEELRACADGMVFDSETNTCVAACS